MSVLFDVVVALQCVIKVKYTLYMDNGLFRLHQMKCCFLIPAEYSLKGLTPYCRIWEQNSYPKHV